MTAQHTPLPWRMVTNTSYLIGNQYGFLVRTLDNISVSKDQAATNAQFIVTAVNAYYPHLAEIDMLKERVANHISLMKKLADLYALDNRVDIMKLIGEVVSEANTDPLETALKAVEDIQ
jgi:hypothetical protein